MIEHKARCKTCPQKIEGKGFTETIVWAQQHRDTYDHSVSFIRKDTVLLKSKTVERIGQER